ncbi:S8 family peptidase [Deinococcus sp. UR1]|uniref:S8 family peptidase n=3 Tax=Deinococcus TaxID=1298 RepID=UPI000C195ACA|nr:S8 family serine peptidase [Deinococcus sp. UR1]PIG98680.1 peptidase S8 [Deinococcus sp. UR1]
MKKRNLMMLGAALTLGGLSQADAGRLSPTLLARAQKGDQTKVGVIVRFNLPNDERGRAQFKNLRAQLNTIVAQLGSAAGILGSANVKQATNLWLDQSIFLPLSPVEARRMAQLPFVSDVFENFKVQIPKPQRAVALSAAAAAPGEAWHLAKIGAPQAWAAGFKGQGVRIGHLDSGIDASHPQLNGKVAAFAEFNGEGERVNGAATRDTTNHGTHTAGLLVGDTVGVAPSAKVISALVLPNNEGTFAQVIAGMQYVLDPDNNADTDDGADIVNMSLGIPGTFDEFIVPVQNMIKAGVVPMFAIGNFGPTSASTGSPGNLPDAIGVGAVDRNGQVASFSSRGPVNWNSTIKGVFVKPDIAAPGVEITSAFPNGQYGALSGSSQASPIAAGAAALLLSAKPGTNVDGIKNALYTSASNAGSKNNNTGFGLISVPGALGKLGVNAGAPAPAPTPAPAPAPTPTPTPTPTPPPAPTPTPAPAPAPTGPAGYTLCALEGSKCDFSGQKDAAFGTAGKYLTGVGTDGFNCTVAEWGRDPAPGLKKGCFIKDRPGSGAAPAPAPAPTPAPAPSAGKKPRVLLVDDDMGQGPDVTAALRDAIKANAVSGGAFVWNTQSQGAVPLSEMKRADIVVWATGEQYQNTITAADQNTLRQYVAGGGNLLITGQDIGYDIGTSAFYTGTLKARFVADSSGNTKFVTGGAFGSTAFTLNAQGSAANQYYPDVIADLGGSATVASWGTANATAGTITAQSIRVDPNRTRAAQKVQDPRGLVERLAANILGGVLNQILGGNTQSAQNRPRVSAQSAGENAGAIVANDAGSYRTVTMGFGLEGLTPNSRNILMKTSFDWLMK